MRFIIKHESARRMRVHMQQCHMTISEADLLETYLKDLPFVREAKVYERTADAVIYAADMVKDRNDMIRALAKFDYNNCHVAVPEHTGREISHEYTDRMVGQVLRWGLEKALLPGCLRNMMTVVRAIPRVIEGIRSLARFSLKVPVLDATSVGVSLARKEYDTASQILMILGIGDTMEEWTHKKSVNDLAKAFDLNVEKVWIRSETGQELLTDINEVKQGDVMLVRTGTMIPLDGVVSEGDAMINQSSITGEGIAVHKTAGGFIYAGTVVEEGELAVEVRNSRGTGRYDRVVAMIEESEKLKSETENRASRLADRLVLWTFGATALTYLFTRNMTRAVSILMVDFCCALKLSMPIAVLSAMREAKELSISVKGGKMMEDFAEATTIVFDKTGTLTKATPVVADIITFGGRDKREMLTLAACLEEHYPHSIANAVVKKAEDEGLVHEERHSKVKYVVAHGITSSVDGESVCIGSHHFIFEDEGCVLPEDERELFENLPDEYSHLYMSIGNELAAVILIEDPLKEEATHIVGQLHDAGINRIVMMTGDSDRTAKAVAQKCGVDEYYSEVLPEDKASYIAGLRRAGEKVIMIGDGINDSPALSEANVGVAMNSGAALAREIADVTISGNDLASLLLLRRLSIALMERIRRNYRGIISFNSLLILLGMAGILDASKTALLHNASTIAISVDSMKNMIR